MDAKTKARELVDTKYPELKRFEIAEAAYSVRPNGDTWLFVTCGGRRLAFRGGAGESAAPTPAAPKGVAGESSGRRRRKKSDE